MIGWLLFIPTAFATVVPTPPALSINVDDGRTDISAGDQTTYTIRVRNLGKEPLGNLVISQSLPATMDFADTDGGRWRVTVPAGEQRELTVKAAVKSTPDGQSELATTVCAHLKAGQSPLVCSSDINAVTTASSRSWAFAAAGATGLSLLTVLGLRLRQRRRLAHRASQMAAGALERV